MASGNGMRHNVDNYSSEHEDYVAVIFAKSINEAEDCRMLLDAHSISARIESGNDEDAVSEISVMIPVDCLEAASDLLSSTAWTSASPDEWENHLKDGPFDDDEDTGVDESEDEDGDDDDDMDDEFYDDDDDDDDDFDDDDDDAGDDFD